MKDVLLLGALALAACGTPLWRVPPTVRQHQSMLNPPGSVGEIASVELSRTGCMGRCPVYSFSVNANQTAHYDGVCFTPLLGGYEAPLDTAAFARVARAVLQSDYFRSDTVLGLVIDASSVVITVTLADGRRRTVWYGPGSSRDLGSRIEAVASVLPWRYVAPPRSPGCAT